MQTETIQESAKLKQNFQFTLSRLGHEIRNPIALISSELQLMASSHPEVCRFEQWDDLMDNLDYIKELLNELSDFSHSGTVSLTPVNITEFLSTIIACEKHTLDYLGITLETHLEPISSPVLIDRIKMRQALLNLFRNACEAIAAPRGRITVRLTRVDDCICISVADNGCGMTREQMQKIFTPFVTYKPSGTGLGLAVTKEIITAHHGNLTVDSAPGQGSVFSIFLK